MRKALMQLRSCHARISGTVSAKPRATQPTKATCAAKPARASHKPTIAQRHSPSAISISIPSAENIPPSIAAAEFCYASVGVGLALPTGTGTPHAVVACGFSTPLT